MKFVLALHTHIQASVFSTFNVNFCNESVSRKVIYLLFICISRQTIL